MLYGSDVLSYDLDAALASANREAEGRPHGQALCRADLLASALSEVPSEVEFRKHRHRFGGEGIQEIAGSYDLKAAAKEAKRLEPKVKRNRRTTAELRAQVIDLAERGLVAATIADSLNLSDRRVASNLRHAA